MKKGNVVSDNIGGTNYRDIGWREPWTLGKLLDTLRPDVQAQITESDHRTRESD